MATRRRARAAHRSRQHRRHTGIENHAATFPAPGHDYRAALIIVAWCLASIAALLLPTDVLPAYLLGCTLLLAAANLVRAGRANALAEVVAPPHARGRYLAAFQYAFTIAGVLAPAVVALFEVAAWLPWIVLACFALLGTPALHWVIQRLPEHVQAAPH